MKKYVVGLIFWNNKILLIHKTKGPINIIGTWNGIGGKIEETDPTISHAMSRECLEETKIDIKPENWILSHTLSGDNYALFFFKTTLDKDIDYSFAKCEENDGEIVEWHDLENIYKINLSDDLEEEINIALK